MKFSTLQMVTIICILAVGFMTAAPFVQVTEAEGDAHFYVTIMFEIIEIECTECGVPYAERLDNWYFTWAGHDDGLPHITFKQVVGSEEQGMCIGCAISS